LDELKVHHERLVGSRGDAGIFGNALPTLLLLLDAGKWGLNGVLEVLAAVKENKLYGSLKHVIGDQLVYAMLRVMVFLNVTLFRPVHTFSQHPATTQAQMVKVWVEYRDAIRELQGATWTELREEQDWWRDEEHTMVMAVAEHERVLHVNRAEKIKARREHAMKECFYSGFDDEHGTATDSMEQCDEWCTALLHAALKGALQSWEDLSTDR